MAQKKVRFHPAAAAEADRAARWYAERNPIAGRAFVAELDLAVRRVGEAPDRWPSLDHGARTYVFPRFPFSLIYRLIDGNVEILAVAHHKRKPGYWEVR